MGARTGTIIEFLCYGLQLPPDLHCTSIEFFPENQGVIFNWEEEIVAEPSLGPGPTEMPSDEPRASARVAALTEKLRKYG